MTGNVDTTSHSRTRLEPPIRSRVVRVVPYSDQPRIVCLRLELFGCSASGSEQPFLLYSSPPPDLVEAETRSRTDWDRQSERGVLTDGQFGMAPSHNSLGNYGQ